VANLKPDTNYVFLVRAENSHGMSPPSRISKRARTLRVGKDNGNGGNNGEPGEVDLALVREALAEVRLVELSSLESVSSTSIRVSWRLRKNEGDDDSGDAFGSRLMIEGFFVRFRDMSGGSQKFNMKTVMLDGAERDGDGITCMVTDLRKVFIFPNSFWLF